MLIGGFRYRLLDDAPRVSEDIDYHWGQDLDEKQGEIVGLIQRKVLPEIKECLGYDGTVQPATGPDADSPSLRIIQTAFWREGVPYSRIEVPVELTRIACADRPIVRTIDGVVYSTPTDGDMIESKIMALLNRRYVKERDFVDVFLFSSNLTEESVSRLRKKVLGLGMTGDDVERRKGQLRDQSTRFVQGIQAVMDRQVEQTTAGALEAAGGARMIYDTVMELLDRYVVVGKDASP